MKRIVTIPIITICFFMLFGCGYKGSNINSTSYRSTSTSLLNAKTSSDLSENKSTPVFHISNTDFFEAIKLFNPELAQDGRVVEAFTKLKPSINQLYLDNDNSYIIAWTNSLGYLGAFEIFQIKERKIVPIYCNTYGSRIESIKVMDESISNKALCEIIYYAGSSSFMNQFVNILSIDGNNVQKVWEYTTIQTRMVFNVNKKLVPDIQYNAFVLVPGYMYNPDNVDNAPCIIVKDNNDKEIRFFWNSKQAKFIKSP